MKKMGPSREGLSSKCVIIIIIIIIIIINQFTQKEKGTKDDQRRDEGTNFILRIKEQETRLTLLEHDYNDDIW